MKKLIILVFLLLMCGCQNAFRDDTLVKSIEASGMKDFKYRVEFCYAGDPVFIYTNKECKVGKTIWDCE